MASLRLRALAAALAVTGAAIGAASAAHAGPGNDQSTTVLCRDADYADLHPTLCIGPFSLGHGGGPAGGGGGSLFGGIPVVGGLLKGLGL